MSSPDQISSRLSARYVTDGVSSEHQLLQHLFPRALHRYLHGCGHPDHDRVRAVGQISDDAFVSDRNNPWLRAQLLLRAATDSSSLPLDSDWAIKVRNLTFFHARA